MIIHCYIVYQVEISSFSTTSMKNCERLLTLQQKQKQKQQNICFVFTGSICEWEIRAGVAISDIWRIFCHSRTSHSDASRNLEP